VTHFQVSEHRAFLGGRGNVLKQGFWVVFRAVSDIFLGPSWPASKLAGVTVAPLHSAGSVGSPKIQALRFSIDSTWLWQSFAFVCTGYFYVLGFWQLGASAVVYELILHSFVSLVFVNHTREPPRCACLCHPRCVPKLQDGGDYQ